jgi:hypothetical protein
MKAGEDDNGNKFEKLFSSRLTAFPARPFAYVLMAGKTIRREEPCRGYSHFLSMSFS